MTARTLAVSFYNVTVQLFVPIFLQFILILRNNVKIGNFWLNDWILRYFWLDFLKKVCSSSHLLVYLRYILKTINKTLTLILSSSIAIEFKYEKNPFSVAKLWQHPYLKRKIFKFRLLLLLLLLLHDTHFLLFYFKFNGSLRKQLRYTT